MFLDTQCAFKTFPNNLETIFELVRNMIYCDFSVDGEWGSWGSFGGCSATCGGGVMEKFRSCNSPPAQYGGKKCVGFSKYVKTCNTNHCPG